MTSGLAKAHGSRLLLVDLQQGLVPHVHDGDQVVRQCANLLTGARALGVPVLVSEHYPKGLGHTVEGLAGALQDGEVLSKNFFSCLSEPSIRSALLAGKRRTLVVAGMEAHVCVMQSALEAKAAGLDVLLVADAVGSRRPSDRDIALTRMANAGITLVSREMLLFEWCERGDSDVFKAVLAQCLREKTQ